MQTHKKQVLKNHCQQNAATASNLMHLFYGYNGLNGMKNQKRNQAIGIHVWY